MSTNPKSLQLHKIFYRPREVIQGSQNRGNVHLSAGVIAFAFGVIQASNLVLRMDTFSARTLLFGGIGGLLLWGLASWLMRNFARWFGGEATVREVRTALGLGLLPWTILFGMFALLVAAKVSTVMLAAYYWLFFVGLLYGYVIMLQALSEALKLTLWKTFFAVVLTFVFSIFPITLLLQLAAPNLLPAPQ